MNLASTGFTGGYPDIPETHDFSATIHRILYRDAQFLFKAIADGSIRPQEQPLRFISILTNTIFGLADRLLPRDEHFLREQQSSD